MVDQTDLDWWLDLAPSLQWRFAKTMPDWPHSYVVRGQTLDEEDFVRAVKVIRSFGEPAKFFARTNVYLTRGEQKWWTMGEPIDKCQIINTADTKGKYGRQDAPHTESGLFSVYDTLATEYDARYSSPECQAENIKVWRIVDDYFGRYPVTLDVGAGTGLLLDLHLTTPKNYTGVDPSQAMLNELVRKHPAVRSLVPAKAEDAVADGLSGHRFELVAGLFGSPSYIAPDTIERLPSLCTDLLILMHYEPGYLPDYWESWDKPDTLDSSRDAARSLLDRYPGTFTTIGKFHVVQLHLGAV